jgi:type IV secretory pathway VirB10-like protein
MRMRDADSTEPVPARACPECGAAQDEHQEMCVECGAAAPRPRGPRLRRIAQPLALAIFAVLVVASAAFGVTSNFGGDSVHTQALAAAQPPAPAPAATPPPAAAPAPAPPAPPTTPAPPASTPAPAPPKPSTTTPTPASAATPAAPATPPASSGSPSSTPSQHHSSPSSTPARSHHQSSAPAWLSQGDQPYSATLHDPYAGNGDEHASKAGLAVDGKAKTAWTTADHSGGLGKPGVGLVIEAGGYQGYSGLGIQTATPGFDVQVYSTDQSNPPAGAPDAGGWKLEGSRSTVAKQQRVSLKGANAQPQYLLVWITKLPAGKTRAGLSELSLIP